MTASSSHPPRLAGANRWRRHAVLAAGALLSLVLMLSTTGLVWQARNNEIADWKSRAVNASNALAAHTRQSIRAAQMTLVTIRQHAEATGATTPAEFQRRVSGSSDIAEVISHYTDAAPIKGLSQIASVAMVSVSGDVIRFEGRPSMPAINISDRDYFEAAMRPGSAGTVISAPVRSRSDGAWTIFLARPVMAPSPDTGAATKIGLVMVGIPVAFFQDFFKVISPGNGSVMRLFRRDGVLLARNPPDDNLLGKSYLASPIFTQGFGQARSHSVFISGSGGLSVNDAAASCIVAVNALDDIGFVTAATIQEELYLARFRSGISIVFPIIGLICFVILVFTAVVWRLLLNQERDGMAVERALVDVQQSQARLQYKTEMFDLTLQHMDQGIAMISADGLVPICNKRALDLLDLPPEVLLGRTTITEIMKIMRDRNEYDLIEPTLRESIEHADTVATPAVYIRERPNGIKLEMRCQYMPDGGVIRTMADVTARMDLEAKLRQVQRMEAVGQLTAGIAHDFNNVLGIIVGNIELTNDLIVSDPTAAISFCAEALDATDLAAQLVSGLLAFSRMKSLSLKPTNLRTLLDMTQPMLRQALAGDMEVEIIVADDCWPVVVDAMQLQSALINLATNAKSASPSGSWLEITASNVAWPGLVATNALEGGPDLLPGDYVCVRVADQGSGMSADTRARIFEPFFTTRTVGKGSGLGMSMVHGTMQQMGGAVQIESVEREGTTISLYLRRAA